ncbi:MAG: putative lipid II flippase FtsW [Nitrospira sp.]|nr:putative lipid II flippase FtsW [Nitrospira sp.]
MMSLLKNNILFSGALKENTSHEPVKKDKILLIAAFALVAFGTIMIYSASAIMALDSYGDSLHFLKRQVAWIAISIIGMALISRIDIETWKKISMPLLLISWILLLLVLIPGIGSKINSARRWFRVGPMSFQPSELAKLSIIVYMSGYLINRGEKIRDFWNGFVPPLLVVGITFVLILAEPDMGTAFVIGVGSAAMLFIGGASMAHIGGLSLLAVPAGFFLIKNIGYRMNRVKAFLDPWSDPFGVGYQIRQSFLAFGNGGFLGKGIGEGRQKLFFLPEAHTDFVFSVVGEELGFAGCLLVTVCLIFFLWRCFRIIKAHWGSFEGYIATGITIFIGVQIALNLFVVTGMFPTKGLALPFISFGGTSLLTNMVMTGILYSISGKEPDTSKAETHWFITYSKNKIRNQGRLLQKS